MRLSHCNASPTHSAPFTGFRLFEDAVTHLMSSPQAARPRFGAGMSPAVDIVESEEGLTLKADLPDVKLEDINVCVENNTLTLSGHRKFEKDQNVKGYHRIERSFGDFTRTFAIPSSVNNEAVSADYANGVLTIQLPKKEAAKPRQVKVAVQNGDVKPQPTVAT